MRPKRPTTPKRRARFAAVLMVGVVVVLGAMSAAPRTSRGAAEGLRTPQVRVRQLSVAGGLAVAPDPPSPAPSGVRTTAAVTLDADEDFTMIGVTCDVPTEGGPVAVRIRTSLDGRGWSPWYEGTLELAADGAPRAFTEAVWTGAGRYVQVSARAATGRAPVELENVRVVALDSVASGDAAGAGESAGSRTAAPVTSESLASAVAASLAAPTIVTRQGWGADESLRTSAPSYANVKMAFVHHTAGGNTYSQADAPALVRGIYAYHTQALGWSDIGYNFLIDRFGTIYEGRYGGVSAGVIGAQVLGFNTGSAGVSIIGTYSSAAPPAAAVDALERLLAWKFSLSGLDPAGKAAMTCGSTEKFKAGAAVALPAIAGHRDANFTECPGDALYALLPTVRAAVGKLMNPTKWIVALKVTPASIPANSTVTYSGSVKTVTGKAGAGTVTIQRRPASGGDWSDWRAAPLGAEGTYALVVRMTNSNTWQLRTKMPGASGTLTGFSSSQGLTVRRAALPQWRVTLSLSAISVRAGSSVRYSGSVKTASGSAGSGTVAIQRRHASGGSWLTWRTARLDARGGYALSVKMTNRNSWVLRARMAGTATSLVGYSAGRELTVL